jgi:hypothetical protein
MNKKRWLLYGLLGGLLIMFTFVFYVYYEYLGEDPEPDTEHAANPIIKKRLNAVVLRTESINADNDPKLEVAYSDLDSKESASFTVNEEYNQSIHVGDTVTKDKWDKVLFVYQKSGGVETVPID